ncbi:hypothetical protein PENFLA_c009G00254 [Penicillium flavigenum]|uniref:Plastocyanin-like domain-containing protein n=1 Tax=Penicillium flavigenum TaxID=254877 RepID=A0A1V6TF86_9EURO|nr:hypothetical protein PENFLA_c009G00254 [Penicillium flavigenum]
MATWKAFVALAANGLVQLTWAEQINFDLDLIWQKGAPDGNVRKMIFMNNKFPGLELRIDQGDNVEFVVHNNMPFNITIHFPGIEQRNTPWSDGVPGLTQSISNKDMAGHIVGPPPSTVLTGVMPML